MTGKSLANIGKMESPLVFILLKNINIIGIIMTEWTKRQF